MDAPVRQKEKQMPAASEAAAPVQVNQAVR